MEGREKLIESINSLGNKIIIHFNDEVIKYLQDKIKGSIEIRLDVDLQEISYIVHIDYDDRYFSQNIKFDEILRKDMYVYRFCDCFIEKIQEYYLSKIIN